MSGPIHRAYERTFALDAREGSALKTENCLVARLSLQFTDPSSSLFYIFFAWHTGLIEVFG